MLINELLTNTNKIPYKINFSKENPFTKFEERYYVIEQYYADIIGINRDSIEFCPNHKPPEKNEILAWLFIIYPEFETEILEYANDTLKRIIKEFKE